MNRQYAREIGWGHYFLRTFLFKFQKVILRRDPRKTLPTGLAMRLPRDRAQSAEIYGTNCLTDWGAEDLLLDYLDTCGEPGQRQFYDVGANIGFYSLLVSPKAGAVHAFEPDPRNLGPLRANTAQAVNIHVVEKAVAADCEQRRFDVSGGHETNHLVSDADAPPGDATILVETTTLDAYRAAHPGGRVAAVKMDVEGYECEALAGAHALTDQEQPVYLIEFFLGPPHVNTLERLGEFLGQHNYVVYSVVREHDFARTRRAELRRLTLEEFPTLRTKMLFLAPAATGFFADRLGVLPARRR